ncbi:MAG: alcohol dehydrogenase catalytic domain-containing protein [Caldilineaceae bacterium]|nr:alcohol dehydrogenase catalytic domain-containing protein [Caldilineaceae bacterium]
MKALYATAPGEYSLADRPKPAPGVGEALVKVTRTGFCMNDVRVRDGVLRHGYPVIPGHQFAGVVEACGPEVNDCAPGDRVAVHSYVLCGQCPSCRKGGVHDCDNFRILGFTLDGGLAEYCVVPARCLFKLPDDVTLEEGSLVENLASAVAAVRLARLEVAERVVIVGATPIGLLALQVARLTSPSTLVMAGAGDRRLALAERLGASHTVDIEQTEARARLSEILGTRGADAVLVCGYSRTEAELAMEVVGSLGRIVIEGHFDPTAEITLSPHRLLVTRAVSVQANRGWLTPDFMRAHELVAGGMVDVKPLVTHTLSLQDWEQAFDIFTNQESQAVQVVLAP